MQRRKKKKRTRFLKTQSKLQREMREIEREREMKRGLGSLLGIEIDSMATSIYPTIVEL
jgi:hypothetical protein